MLFQAFEINSKISWKKNPKFGDFNASKQLENFKLSRFVFSKFFFRALFEQSLLASHT